jgi:hypothetical protein
MKQPTAYAMFRDGEYYDAIHLDEYDKTAGEYDIPLYTHPAKTLTDEEIADIISSGEYWTLDEHLNIVSVHFDKFARAILRKAQEK